MLKYERKQNNEQLEHYVKRLTFRIIITQHKIHRCSQISLTNTLSHVKYISHLSKSQTFYFSVNNDGIYTKARYWPTASTTHSRSSSVMPTPPIPIVAPSPALAAMRFPAMGSLSRSSWKTCGGREVCRT